MRTILTLLFIFITNILLSQNLSVIGDSIFSYTLQERKNNNIKSELFMSETLCNVARIQAEFILRTGEITHTNPEYSLRSPNARIQKFGYKGGGNENITCFSYNGKSDDLVAKSAVNNFMSSLGHRITLLTGDTFIEENYKTAYGHCILFDAHRNRIIVVQVFVYCIYESDSLIK